MSDDQRVGIEVRVALSTLLGHDEQPGEIPGLGPVPASHARAVVARQRRAEWRYAITDGIGRLLFDGVTRRRPAGLTTTGPPGGIVELHVPAALLATLTTSGEMRGLRWRAGRAYWPTSPASTANATGATSTPTPTTGYPVPRCAATPRSATAPASASAAAAAPPAATRTTPSTTGTAAPTVAADLAPLCRHDHTLKGQAGWTLRQPSPGTFLWISPLGGRYPVRPEPVLPPLPDPCPGPDNHQHDQPAPPAPDSLTLWTPDPPPSPPDGDAEPIDLDTPPPF